MGTPSPLCHKILPIIQIYNQMHIMTPLFKHQLNPSNFNYTLIESKVKPRWSLSTLKAPSMCKKRIILKKAKSQATLKFN